MEAMAMGIPSVGYGGIQAGQSHTKYVARAFDLDSIAQQIIRCWKDLTKPKSTLKKETIAFAQQYFDRGKEVKKYIKLYEELSKKKYGKVI